MTNRKLEDDIDALFQLPLAEFTGARNTLAARLKREGYRDDAERVKLLAKPSISAWTVNQLYWNHRDEFDELIASGKRIRPAQASRSAGKIAQMRDSLDARRGMLSELADLATALLRDAGHTPTLDTIRRVTTALEAISAFALLSDGPTPGRLTQDVDPPSFESLASLMSGGSATEQFAERMPITSRKSGSTAANTRENATADARRLEDVRRLKEARQIEIAAAKVSLQDAKKALTGARARAQALDGTQKKANAEAKEAERYRREAEELLKKATAASEDAARRAQDVSAELEKAVKAAEEAKRAVERATKELELLFATNSHR